MDDKIYEVCQRCQQTFTAKYFDRHLMKCDRLLETEVRGEVDNNVNDSDVENEEFFEDMEANHEDSDFIDDLDENIEEELIHDPEIFQEMRDDFENDLTEATNIIIIIIIIIIINK